MSHPIGYLHIDIAQVRTAEGKLYLFVAIDRTSKFALMIVPGVLHRDLLAKYAVAFRSISTSSFASANSLRSRLLSDSSSVAGRCSGCAGVSGEDTKSPGLRLHAQLLNVAEGDS